MAIEKVFVMAGEASGDVLGAELIQALCEALPQVSITYTGGPAMKAVLKGQTPWVPMERMAFMGFVEVLRHLPQIWRNDRCIKKNLLRERPDLVVLVDYPGYGLRLAKWLDKEGFRKQGTRVVQLVSPQFWAWKPGRLIKLKAFFHAVYPLLPFESSLLTHAGIEAPYFGHPAAYRVSTGGWDPEGPLALLPGSRAQEFAQHVAVFHETALTLGRKARWYRPSHLTAEAYQTMLESYGVQVPLSSIYTGVSAMEGVSAALVASGTATLEVALRGIPLVVAYRTSSLSYALGKRIIRVPYISLVNLILDRPAVQECIQGRCVAPVLVAGLKLAMSTATWPQTVTALREAVDQGDPMPKIVHHVQML